MSNSNQAPNNVIQFPGRRKEAEEKPQTPAAGAPASAPLAKASGAPAPKAANGAARKRKAKMAGTVLAIALATGAVNRYTFEHNIESLDASSFSNVQRTIASIEPVSWQRDAAWEKEMAESLASAQDRAVASTTIGHEPSIEEKLRWGTLGENYTYTFRPDTHILTAVKLQDSSTTNPAYVLDRGRFLKEYGTLLASGFDSAQLKSVEVTHDKTVESYTLFGKDKRPKGEARFELDSHKRLLSLEVD
jgi:hypothetical protein